jgi:hypothetical protein
LAEDEFMEAVVKDVVQEMKRHISEIDGLQAKVMGAGLAAQDAELISDQL